MAAAVVIPFPAKASQIATSGEVHHLDRTEITSGDVARQTRVFMHRELIANTDADTGEETFPADLIRESIGIIDDLLGSGFPEDVGCCS